jgi:hypothetical protein
MLPIITDKVYKEQMLGQCINIIEERNRNHGAKLPISQKLIDELKQSENKDLQAYGAKYESDNKSLYTENGGILEQKKTHALQNAQETVETMLSGEQEVRVLSTSIQVYDTSTEKFIDHKITSRTTEGKKTIQEISEMKNANDLTK